MKQTQKQIVLKQLRDTGVVSRNWCLKQVPAITRLSAIMLSLKKEGVNWEGYQYQHPNDYEYKLLDKPTIIKYTDKITGEVLATKKIW